MRKPVIVRDSRIGTGDPGVRSVVLDGPSNCSYQSINSTQTMPINNPTQLSYTITPPSPNTGIGRYVTQHVEGTFTVTFTNDASALAFGTFLPTLRRWPIASITSNCTVQVNNSTISYGSINQWVRAFAQVQIPSELGTGVLSGTAAAPIMFNNSNAEYHRLSNRLGNGVGTGDSGDATWLPRSAQITSVTKNVTAYVDAANNTTVYTIMFSIDEPLFVPPFTACSADREALFGVNNIIINSQLENVAKMFHLMAATSSQAIPLTTTEPAIPLANWPAATTQLTISRASVNVEYLTINDSSLIAVPKRSILNAASLQYYTTPLNVAVAAGTSSPNNFLTTVQSTNSVTLSVIPRMAIIWATLGQTLTNGPFSFTEPDPLLPIRGCQIQAFNKTSILGGASAEQLYEISHRNGLRAAMWQFLGAGSQTPYFSTAAAVGNDNRIRRLGFANACPVVVDFARDLGLEPGTAPGLNQQTQFQVTCTIANNLNGADLVTVTPGTGAVTITTINGGLALANIELNILFVTDGVLVCEGGASSFTLGGLTQDAVKQARTADAIMSEDITKRVQTESLSGGSFSSFMSSVGDALAPVGKVLGAIAPIALPIGKMLLGAGESGGAQMQRSTLRSRLQATQAY